MTLMICRVVGDIGWFYVRLVMCPGFGDWFGNACWFVGWLVMLVGLVAGW